MDKDKKVKFKNAAEIIGGGIGLGALAAVAMAIEPVLGLARSGKRLANQKKEIGIITEQDVKDALKFYAKHLLVPIKIIRGGAKKISSDVSTRKQKVRAYTPEELQKSGVADLIKLIEHAPSVEVYDDRIVLGDVRIARGGETCKVETLVAIMKGSSAMPYEKYDKLLNFSVIYWDMVEDVALKRMRQIERQQDITEKAAFASEVARRVGSSRQ